MDILTFALEVNHYWIELFRIKSMREPCMLSTKLVFANNALIKHDSFRLNWLASWDRDHAIQWSAHSRCLAPAKNPNFHIYVIIGYLGKLSPPTDQWNGHTADMPNILYIERLGLLQATKSEDAPFSTPWSSACGVGRCTFGFDHLKWALGEDKSMMSATLLVNKGSKHTNDNVMMGWWLLSVENYIFINKLFVNQHFYF